MRVGKWTIFYQHFDPGQEIQYFDIAHIKVHGINFHQNLVIQSNFLKADDIFHSSGIYYRLSLANPGDEIEAHQASDDWPMFTNCHNL